MAGVPQVGNTPIGPSNAYKFYYQYTHGEITLDDKQIARCKQFLSADQIEYCESTTDSGLNKVKDAGADKINQKGVEDQGDKGDGKVMAYTGLAASGISAAAILVAIALDGFGQLAIGIIVAACAAINLASALTLDRAYDNRQKQNDSAAENNSELTSQCQKAEEAIEEMQNNRKMYQDAQNERTAILNESINTNAGLKMDLHDAEAYGDEKEANEIRQQIQNNENETDTSAEDDTMEYCRERSSEAELVYAEATGATDAGKSVAEFLNGAEPFEKIAKIQTTLNSILGTASTTAGMGAFPKWLADIAPSGAAKVLLIASGLVYMAAAKLYGTKQGKEAECVTNGTAMDDQCTKNIGKLALLREEIDASNTAYDSSDKSAEDDLKEIEDGADAAVEENNATIPPRPEKGTGPNNTGSEDDENKDDEILML